MNADLYMRSRKYLSPQVKNLHSHLLRLNIQQFSSFSKQPVPIRLKQINMYVIYLYKKKYTYLYPRAKNLPFLSFTIENTTAPLQRKICALSTSESQNISIFHLEQKNYVLPICTEKYSHPLSNRNYVLSLPSYLGKKKLFACIASYSILDVYIKPRYSKNSIAFSNVLQFTARFL